MTAPVGDNGVRRCYRLLFSALACVKILQAAGPLCSADDQRSCESRLAAFLRMLPNHSLELYDKSGVDGAIRERVEG